MTKKILVQEIKRQRQPHKSSISFSLASPSDVVKEPKDAAATATATARRHGGRTHTIRASASIIRSMAKRSDERRSSGREKPHLHTRHAGWRPLMAVGCINSGSGVKGRRAAGDNSAVSAHAHTRGCVRRRKLVCRVVHSGATAAIVAGRAIVYNRLIMIV